MAGIQVCVGTMLNLWFPDVKSSGHILPRVDTGSRCPDVDDRRPGDSAQSPGFFIRSGRSSVGGTLRID